MNVNFINFDTDLILMDRNYADVKQTINYLACSKLNIGLIINFGEDSLTFKRVILT